MKLQKLIFSLLSSPISIRYIWIIHYTCTFRLKDVNRRSTEEKERFVEETQKATTAHVCAMHSVQLYTSCDWAVLKTYMS